MSRPTATILAVVAALLLPDMRTQADPVTAASDVEISGTEFRITRDDGTRVTQQDLPGTILTIGDGSGAHRRIRIDSSEIDTRDRAGDIRLYGLSQQGLDGAWRPLCEPDIEGRRLGFPLPGAIAADGRHVDTPGKFFLTCIGGALGKCVRFGYKPWGTAPDGRSLAAFYQTCSRLVRADYCGDGIGHTRNGTPIDIFDTLGIQADETAPGMDFEAAWGPDGATCVRHTRLPDVLDLDDLARQCPHLAGHLGPSCGEGSAGLLFNRSFGRRS